MESRVRLIVTLCCALGCAALVMDEDAKRAAPPLKPAESLKLSVAVAPGQRANENLPLLVSFENTGEADLMLNLGIMLAGGQKQFPTAIELILDDGVKRELNQWKPVAVFGRVDDYVVPLRVGASYVIRLSLDDFWYKDAPGKRIVLKPGKYQVRAAFKGKAPSHFNGGMGDLRLMKFWTEEVQSEAVVVAV